jgi:hypothetical protein
VVGAYQLAVEGVQEGQQAVVVAATVTRRQVALPVEVEGLTLVEAGAVVVVGAGVVLVVGAGAVVVGAGAVVVAPPNLPTHPLYPQLSMLTTSMLLYENYSIVNLNLLVYYCFITYSHRVFTPY